MILCLSTERQLTTFKLTSKAREALGLELGAFERAVQDRSIMNVITVVNGPLDIILSEKLLLPEEYYCVYNMNSTEGARLSELKRLLKSHEIPEVTKDSIVFILAVFNMHRFGVFSHNPERFLEKA